MHKIDVTTKAGMDRLVELYTRKTLGQIIRECGMDETERNLEHRITRYVRDGALIYRRKQITEKVLLELASRGICKAEAARELGVTPVQIGRAARYFGVPFFQGTRGVAAVEKPAKWEPPVSAKVPKEIRDILSKRWANATAANFKQKQSQNYMWR